MWPIALRIADTIELKREDRLWRFFFIGMFLVMALGMAFWPFMGAQLIPISAFQAMTAAAGTPMIIPMVPYMLVNLIMTAFVMAAYLLLMKLVRVDIGKLKSIDPEVIEKTMPLPPMDARQKALLIMIPFYLLALLLPSFVPAGANSAIDFLRYIGSVGVVLMVFVAMLTPAASPCAGMIWANKQIYEPREILIIGFPKCCITLLSYIFIGYPLAKTLCAAFGIS